MSYKQRYSTQSMQRMVFVNGSCTQIISLEKSLFIKHSKLTVFIKTQTFSSQKGLTDDQLRQVFDTLEIKQNSDEIYEDWIGSMPNELVDISIKSYSGINLTDPKQRDELLFPALRYNMRVINYWLSNVIFPREARVFERKLMCTSWDLCTEHMKHTVTGFSGTNDTKDILPITVSQNDLPELEQTNEKIRETLLRPENQAYVTLPANVSGRAILNGLVEQKIPVLLDAGALILELNNEQVAHEWLKIVSSNEYDAAVFFDTRNILMTIDRNDILAEYDSLVYRDKLDRCVVYLDDVHTRGTDLKFPLGSKACVTLSGEITRYKTVQACMRMRLLGKGHSIAFWASFETDVRLRQLCQLDAKMKPTNKHVIEFICDNSKRLQKDNVVHWAAAAINYVKKLSAHKLYEYSDDPRAIEMLSSLCYDDESVTLEEMYGGKDNILLSRLFETRFDRFVRKYDKFSEIKEFIMKVKSAVNKKIQSYVPDVKRCIGSLDEEQEKELEREEEEERKIEQPPKAKPAKPDVDPNLREFIKFGVTHLSINQLITSKTILPVAMALQNTKLFNFVEAEISPWAEHIYVTKDFIEVIEGSDNLYGYSLFESHSRIRKRHKPFAWDYFLRPVWWIACIRDAVGKYKILILSTHECNALLPEFRTSKFATLHMYRARTSQFHSNLLHDKYLCVTGASQTGIDLKDEVQISMFAGAQYFGNDKEQDAYCEYLGLIPRPRTNPILQLAFIEGLIQPNGFVPMPNRKRASEIFSCVGNCPFQQNPVSFAIQIISAHHEFIRTESHAASILQKGIKASIRNCVP